MSAIATRHENYDVVVCGGGLAGVCAAIAAARHGTRTCLLHDRPVLGGNSSSEVRVLPNGAATFHAYARETGIISELLIEERARNHQPLFGMGATNSVWDMVLYDAVTRAGVTLHLNTAVDSVVMATSTTIRAVSARVANAETQLQVTGALFIDCTGDGFVAVRAGCAWRMGCEASSEFGESHAPAEASDEVMGSSLLFRTVDTGRPMPFRAPDWAVRYDDATFFYEQGRSPRPLEGGYWWLELSVPWHTIFDNERLRHELTRHLLGVWDWVKNRDPDLKERAATYALDWLGQVPGKRESRRVLGRYFLTERDLDGRTRFADEVAYGGWFVDLHTPGGLLAGSSEASALEGGHDAAGEAVSKRYVGPFGLPLRMLVARDVDNLLMAGRNVSASHVALGSVRVMGTTALMGQAAGTAAALAAFHKRTLAEFIADPKTVQQALLRDGCFLLTVSNQDPSDLARSARITSSSERYSCGAADNPTCGEAGETAIQRLEAQGGERLLRRRGQWMAVSGRVERVSICLSNLSAQLQSLSLELRRPEHIWDYRSHSLPCLACTTLELPPGDQQWLDWPLELETYPYDYVRLDLLANPHVRWHSASANLPGQPCAAELEPDRLRAYGPYQLPGWPMRFRIHPPQRCYRATNVLSGVSRPHKSTNAWYAAADDPAPWLALEWASPQQLATIELSFPGHLSAEYGHHYPPGYRAPDCPCDYTLSVWVEEEWRVVVTEQGNYQRHRRYDIAAVSTTKLRLAIQNTCGDAPPGVYEVRCYGLKATSDGG